MVHKCNKKDILDRFYTNPIVVNELLKEIDLTQYELVIEPSAGCGNFSLKIPNCVAYDIEPQHESIVCQDFLQYQYDGCISRDKILVVGNPPYGNQSKLAVDFIKKSAEFADTIAFILPLSFKKPSLHKRLPENYHLIKQIELGKDSFILNDESYDVPCVFQIWQNQYTPRAKEDKIEPVGFKYCKQSEANCSVRRVGARAGTAFNDVDRCPASHYFLLADNPEELVDKLNKIVWNESNTTGPRSISKQELNKIFQIS